MRKLVTLKFVLITVLSFFAAGTALAQSKSSATQADITIDGKALTVKYAAPSVRGRQVFGDTGLLSRERNYPIWRAGANAATILHTDADLDMKGLKVPKGDYALYVSLASKGQWELIISKQTGQWGLSYNKDLDLGRVKMDMTKPAALVETLKYSLTNEGSNKGKLQLEWENVAASVPFTVK